jgi:hypothetical protein
MASTATRTGTVKTLWGRRAERLDLAAAVRLAGRTDPVRLLRLMADRALVDSRCLQAVLRAALVAARARLSSLRDCHGGRAV